jgi:hypothetical protein
MRWYRLVLPPVLAMASVAYGGKAANAVTVVTFWHMDEPDGTGTMFDSTRTINGTWQNITAGVPGLALSAYRFNGTNSRVVVPDNASLDPGSQPFTSTSR